MLLMTGVLGFSVLLVGNLAASAREDREVNSLAGRVVDTNGKGVAGATVWVVGGTENAPETVAETVTDVDGNFRLTKLPDPATGNPASKLLPRPKPYSVVGRAKDGRLAWTGGFQITRQNPKDLRLQLTERADVRGRLVDQAGKPISGLEIMPTALVRNEQTLSGMIQAILPSSLASSLRVTTAADGSFVFAGWPRFSFVKAKIRVEGLGAVGVSWRPTPEPITITLDRRLGTVTGRLKLPGQSRLEGTSTMTLQLFPGGRGQSGEPYLLFSDTRKIVISADGTFRVEAMLPGRYLLTLDLDQAAPFVAFFRSNNPVTVEPGATAVLPEIPLEPAVAVTGRVIDADTQKGIPGVSIWGTLFDLQNRGSVMLRQVTTDEQGRYRLKAARGSLSVRAIRVPAPYLTPDPNPSTSLEVSAERSWPDIKLARGARVEGRVVDAAGQPVAGAEISLTASGSGLGVQGTIRSADNGKFTLDGLPAGPVAIRGRVMESGATTNGAIVVRAGTSMETHDHGRSQVCFSDPGDRDR